LRTRGTRRAMSLRRAIAMRHGVLVLLARDPVREQQIDPYRMGPTLVVKVREMVRVRGGQAYTGAIDA
jgi:hypothetical protein